jgi:hypothetical protein
MSDGMGDTTWGGPDTPSSKEKKKGYTVNDRRGVEDPKPTCRVCGAPEEHSKEYNKPTMDCIKHLRKEITLLRDKLSSRQ